MGACGAIVNAQAEARSGMPVVGACRRARQAFEWPPRLACARAELACGQPPETNDGGSLQQDLGETDNRHRLGGQMARNHGQIK